MSTQPIISRRRFLRLSSGLLAPAGLAAPALLAPGRARADAGADERKFLFLYCFGGWDTTLVFSPLFENTNVDMEGDAVEAELNGIRFVDQGARPSVRSFFERYGDRAAVINGFEVRSVTHERCQRLLLTDSSESDADDWATVLAANSAQELLLPHLVLFGPAYSSAFTSQVVRVGGEGQLPSLLTGDALAMSDQLVSPPSASAEALADAFLAEELSKLEAAAGQPGDVLSRYRETLDQMSALDAIAGDLNLLSGSTGCSRDIGLDAASALDCFQQGLSRCAMVQYDGWCDTGWDTHQSNDLQSRHFEEFFAYLNGIMEDLDGRTSASGAPLADEVTIVVLSEMGRHPQKNAWGGRDHWTYTSLMLVGAGVRGGQVVGAWDEDMMGRPVDLSTGEATDGGVALGTAHIGATLLALGDLDPGDWLPQGELPIEAVLS